MRADLRERSVGTLQIVEEDAENREYTVRVRDAGGRALGMLRWPFEDVAVMTSGSSEENPSDLMTKYLHKDVIGLRLEGLGLEVRGRKDEGEGSKRGKMVSMVAKEWVRRGMAVVWR